MSRRLQAPCAGGSHRTVRTCHMQELMSMEAPQAGAHEGVPRGSGFLWQGAGEAGRQNLPVLLWGLLDAKGNEEKVNWERTTSVSRCPCLYGWVHGRTWVLGMNLFVTDRLGSSEVAEVAVMISPSEKDRLEYITQAETHWSSPFSEVAQSQG